MAHHPPNENAPAQARPVERALWLLIPAAVALVLRVLRLDWQPLWWDEGYSVYFAGEPLPRMAWLTAHDIHPPLYYALLHGWSLLTGGASPVTLRLFSVTAGVAAVLLLGWLGQLLFPQRARVAGMAALLLAVSPMHLFYSQEVRMYAQAAALCLAATGLLWISVVRLRRDASALLPLAGSAILIALALYTLYYAALLLAALGLWALWQLRRTPHAMIQVTGAFAAALLAYVPWLLYALPKLVNYVAQKVESDQDKPLGPLLYLWKHLRAFTVGHVEGGPLLTTAAVPAIAAFCVLFLLFAMRRTTTHADDAPPNPLAALAFWLLLPALAAFLLGLRLPFFPSGGERLLLMLLPFFLLLVAVLIDRGGKTGLALGTLFVVANLAGIFTFFTVPRYAEHDYRPIVRQVAQQGAPGDTLIAIFPWMLGYWRAYAPPLDNGPAPLLLGDLAVEYGPEVEDAMERALKTGTLWFPEPLSFGSDLPPRMEEYLRAHAANVENRWQSPATRLSAWARLESPPTVPLTAAFDDVQLRAAGAGTTAVSGGAPLPVALLWDSTGSNPDRAVTLRLVDGQGRTWAARDYAPPGSFALSSTPPFSETVGLLVPPALPPGDYTLALGVSAGQGDRLLTSPAASLAAGTLVPIASVEVTLPPQPPNLTRLPMQPVSDDTGGEPRILGVTLPTAPVLAGTPLALDLFARANSQPNADTTLRLWLMGENSPRTIQWDMGWPLPAYPPHLWKLQYPFRLPLAVDIPADFEAGRYTLQIERRGETGARIPLGTLQITRRAASFAPAGLAQPLDPAPLLGTHARIVGYEVTRNGEQVELRLEWAAEQSLLPAHHIFVHADDAAGATLAQDDGAPVTGAGPAPTGSWLPGEYLVTKHRLSLPPGAEVTLSVGLYEPLSGVRLPVSVAGAPAGNAVRLPLP